MSDKTQAKIRNMTISQLNAAMTFQAVASAQLIAKTISAGAGQDFIQMEFGNVARLYVSMENLVNAEKERRKMRNSSQMEALKELADKAGTTVEEFAQRFREAEAMNRGGTWPVVKEDPSDG